MAIVRIGDHLEVEKIHPGNPLFLSQENANAFYRTVRDNLNSPEFVVTRTKPTAPIEATCCYWVNYIYDVALFGKHLCTIYEASRDFVGRKDYYVNVVEIQDNHYNLDELMRFDRNKYIIGDEVVARWKRDEEKRQAEINQKTNTDVGAFLSSFAKEKQYQ